MVLDEMDLPAGSRVASIAWNGYRHLELYHGVSASQRVLHTINPRLHASQVAWMLEHAEDDMVFFDASFVELVRMLQPLVPRVRHGVLLGDQAALERAQSLAGKRCLASTRVSWRSGKHRTTWFSSTPSHWVRREKC